MAVRDGRILGVGSLDDLAAWGSFEVDDTFKDKVILPGFVEAHSHTVVGGLTNQIPKCCSLPSKWMSNQRNEIA